jgi:hypothetical protein
VTLGDRERGAHGRVLDLHRDAGVDGDPGGPAEGAAALFGAPEERAHETVFGARRELQLQLDGPRHAFHQAEHFVRRVETELVAALALAEAERVHQPDGPALGLERGLEHQRAGPVAVGALEVAGRADGPVAGVRAEQAREQRGAVVARQAEPVEGAALAHERR